MFYKGPVVNTCKLIQL